MYSVFNYQKKLFHLGHFVVMWILVPHVNILHITKNMGSYPCRTWKQRSNSNPN